MALKAGLRTLLLAQSSITTLCPAQTIQGKSYNGIFVEKVKQGFLPPYIVISDTSLDPMNTLDGMTGMADSEIDIECVEFTEPEAEALAAAVNAYLRNYTGAAGGSDTIDAVRWQNKQTFIGKDEADARDVWRYNVVLTYQIHHS
jgi:hypothetical protein